MRISLEYPSKFLRAVVVMATALSFLNNVVRGTTMEFLSMWNFICTITIVVVILIIASVFNSNN